MNYFRKKLIGFNLKSCALSWRVFHPLRISFSFIRCKTTDRTSGKKRDNTNRRGVRDGLRPQLHAIGSMQFEFGQQNRKRGSMRVQPMTAVLLIQCYQHSTFILPLKYRDCDEFNELAPSPEQNPLLQICAPLSPLSESLIPARKILTN